MGSASGAGESFVSKISSGIATESLSGLLVLAVRRLVLIGLVDLSGVWLLAISFGALLAARLVELDLLELVFT